MENYVVTISHLLGSGGAEIGEKLSKELDVPFVDRDILKTVAKKLNIAQESIEYREERLSTFWQDFSRAGLIADPLMTGHDGYFLSDRSLFTLESDYIVRIAKNASAVILGRGGRYILRDYQRHVRVFICAEMPERFERVSSLYNVSEQEAEKIILKNDRDRKAYMKAFTDGAWLDPRAYDICLNTSLTGVDDSVKFIERCLSLKLGEFRNGVGQNK